MQHLKTNHIEVPGGLASCSSHCCNLRRSTTFNVQLVRYRYSSELSLAGIVQCHYELMLIATLHGSIYLKLAFVNQYIDLEQSKVSYAFWVDGKKRVE